MYKKVKIIFLSLFTLFLVACGGADTDNTPTVDGSSTEAVEQELITTILMDRQVVSTEAEGMWMNTWYIGDSLYFATRVKDEETSAMTTTLYKKAGSADSVVFYSGEGILIPTLAIDIYENVYYILQEEEQYTLKKLDASGVDVLSQPVSAEIAECMVAEIGVEAAADDRGYYLVTGMGTVLAWDEQLQEQGMLQPSWKRMLQDDATADFGLLNGKEGAYAYYRNGSSITLQKPDVAARDFGEEFAMELPVKPMTQQQTLEEIRLFDGYDKGIYVFFEDSLYTYADDAKGLHELLCWKETTVEIDTGGLNAVGQKEDGRIVLASYNPRTEQGFLMYAEEKLVAGQQIIEIGGLREFLNDTFMREVLATFNSMRGDVQVVYKQYEDLNELHLALVQGKGPDIIDVFGLDMEEYTEKGILEDLSPYFATSEKLKEEDILPALREIMTIDGGIRVVFPRFWFTGIVMNKDVVKEGGMTIEEFLQLPVEGDTFLCNNQDVVLLIYLFPLMQDEYINWENKTCSFDDGRFAQFLKDIKTAKLPARGDTDVSVNPYNGEAILEGKCLALFDVFVEDMRKYRMITDAFGEVAEFVSYPNEYGEEQFVVEQSVGWMGINSASVQKEEAWDFLEFYMLEYAENYARPSSNFSVLEEAFEKQLYPQAKENQEIFYTNPYTGIETKETFDYTDEERDEIRHIVDDLVLYSFSSGIIGEIIQEETKAYFLEDKSAEDVAEIIQSRVSIYMAE